MTNFGKMLQIQTQVFLGSMTLKDFENHRYLAWNTEALQFH